MSHRVSLCLALCAAGLAAAEQPKPKPKPPAEPYQPHPDCKRRPGVPEGKLTKYEWNDSKVYPGTVREYAVYVPARYKSDGPPAALLVCQDGHAYRYIVPVLDNLIADGSIPVTAAVLIDPGHVPSPSDKPRRNGWDNHNHRADEYDVLSDKYVRFLTEEMLPAAEATGVKFSADPKLRAITGRSSGGICSWTAAWQRPDQFGQVISFIGSFTNIRHGDTYPGLIRKTAIKPIRVYLQDGGNDLDNEYGNWPLANRQMAKALAYKGYDYQFVEGEGGHTEKHELAVMPDALRWIWRDWK